ncbi:hypothetical protein PN36_30805 [Candidatus Thiomargarita nelsonii]|uniref:Uncharacterized protein n=1 Tax=Candidatus Thiomargarita nelsonii TaxID=1003181 RepID=A0A4E0RDJ3_9GAMM|nr:hypothetical protein PN36_30805 [Candidatus Thiomargarita nelsonii]
MSTQKRKTKTIKLLLWGLFVVGLYVNAIKLRFFVGWAVGAIPCGCPRNIVMGRPTHHCYKFQRFGGFRSALPTLQKKRIYA